MRGIATGLLLLLASGCGSPMPGLLTSSCGASGGVAIGLQLELHSLSCDDPQNEVLVVLPSPLPPGEYRNSTTFACRHCDTARDDTQGPLTVRVDESSDAGVSGRVDLDFQSGAKLHTDFHATWCPTTAHACL